MSQPGSADPGDGTETGSGADNPNTNTGAPGGAEPGVGQAGAPDVATLQAELEQTKRRMQASDQNNSKLQADLKKLQDEKLSEDEKVKRDLTEVNAMKVKLEEDNKQLQLQLAFVNDNTYQWHDPKAALKLADLSSVEIDSSGNVKGLKEELKRIAEAHKWMIKEVGDESSSKSPTGVPMNTGGKTGDDKKALLDKFPGLRSRVTG